MSAQKLPPGTRAERVAYARGLMQQDEMARPTLRLTRSRRRFAVVGTYSFLAALLVTYSAWFSRSPDQPVFILWSCAALIALPLCFAVVDYAVGGFLSKRDAVLDERERALRDHAAATAYRVLGTLVAVGAFYVIFALNVQWAPLPRSFREAVPYAAALIWLVTTLPKAILAWTLPDPEPG